MYFEVEREEKSKPYLSVQIHLLAHLAYWG